MSAWHDAFATILADPDLAEAASYYAQGQGTAVALRVIRQTAIDPAIGTMGMGSLRGQQMATIAVADLPDQPAPGDVLVIGAAAYDVKAAEADEQRLAWRVTLSE